ncbi:hypothetical protein BVC80_9073g123 [Macleaya cordata]|uniref:Transmembrane protein n=1 Tax=Macleaya cordata TaxID=56857 RepID=A0A200PU20_MACCD|nr:hypothetical protein BVC80_9073g123 [Macleaya cordata]
MFKEKSPGLKILWLWTFGTAAVLVTSVVRTRIRDMEKLMNTEEQQQQQQPPPPINPTDPTLLMDDVQEDS